MRQSRVQSFVEAATNTAAAFALSFTIHLLWVLPATAYAVQHLGWKITDWRIALYTTMLYTAISLLRNYACRRWFNKR